jgi:hypothetical protein
LGHFFHRCQHVVACVDSGEAEFGTEAFGILVGLFYANLGIADAACNLD